MSPESIWFKKDALASKLIPLCVHTGDLSNPAKPLRMCREWADRILKEFWRQGDMERELQIEITGINDRYTNKKPTSQTGFINFVIKPWFEHWGKLCTDPKHGPLFLGHLQQNFEYWKSENEKLQAEEAKMRIQFYVFLCHFCFIL